MSEYNAEVNAAEIQTAKRLLLGCFVSVI